ncbi:hypothetical protein N431DRAFT_428533 [Stipitochalara longipes BDJ]|nr:hypothetical protein N431DRAFT_428533 [Stipitochalara longipes BDJ]
MAFDSYNTDPTAFTIFSKLPKELRCLIWATAAPLRPRVIQLFYEPPTNTWQACKDGCGGLPSIIKVSREARKEALKGYTRAFDTFLDLEEDTVFISDPVFSLRQPMRAFFNAEHTKNLRKVAMSSEVYDGMEQSAIEFPTLCRRPSAVLRRLEGLTHFILALSEDGEGDLYGDSTDDSEAGQDASEEDDSGRDSGVEDIDVEGSPSQTILVPPEDPVEEQVHQISRRLARMEKEALAEMSRGYVRDRGNVHFESAFRSRDHWEDASEWKWMIVDHNNEEKGIHPEWVRPKLSIMVVKYGLKQLGDFYGPIHHQGDYSDVDLEGSQCHLYEDDLRFDPIADAWDELACAADEDGEENDEDLLGDLQGY